MQTTLARLEQISGNLPASLSRVARQPDVARDTAHYLATIGTIKSIDAFMGNERVYQYAVRAFGLEDMAYAKAYLRKVLSEGIDRPDALANRLTDPRFREFAETFNFARYGSAATSFARTQQGTADRFVRQRLEVDVGRTDEALRLALYFHRKAPSVTTPFALLADRALFRVTQVALGLPSGAAGQNIDKQADLITKRLNISDLKNPPALDKLLERFAARWDVQSPAPLQTTLVDLFAGQSASSISPDLLARLQRVQKA
jgi:Protein of unknown function (DUF1217)